MLRRWTAALSAAALAAVGVLAVPAGQAAAAPRGAGVLGAEGCTGVVVGRPAGDVHTDWFDP